MPKPEKQPPENAPEYLKFDANFRPGMSVTPAQITKMVSEMTTHLNGKADKEKLDKNLLALLDGKIGAM